METFTISNTHIRAKIKSLGAELTSLQTADGHEYLWQGHPDHWTGQSPLLFPIIGGLEDDTYEYGGKSWSMKSHGFARKTGFQVECRTPNSIIFNLETSPSTLEIYPFDFRVSVIYTVHDNGLEVEYEVRNLGEKTMPFSIGGHPAFNCPLEDGTKLTDYRLRFEKKETAPRLCKETILTGKTAPCLEDSDTIELSHDLFDEGALIFRNLKSEKTILERKAPSAGRKITMNFPGFTHFGIWKKPKTGAPFICLEPWYGVDSTEGGPKKLEKKEGIVLLEPEGLFRAGYSINLE